MNRAQRRAAVKLTTEDYVEHGQAAGRIITYDCRRFAWRCPECDDDCITESRIDRELADSMPPGFLEREFAATRRTVLAVVHDHVAGHEVTVS